MRENFIPFSRPSIGKAEIDEVVDTLESGWITTGPKTSQFEQEFRDYVQTTHALAVNSATAALHLALAGLGIGQGDEVITTPLTFCATVNTILQVGATPVMADVGTDGNIDVASVAARVTARTRAIMPVHLGGLPCDMDAIWDLARKANLYIIEDAAHAVGARYRSRMIGDGMSSDHRSDAVCFSFYATKNLTTGEGGMVVTHHQELHDRMRVLCLHGISKDAWNRYSEDGSWYYDVVSCGFKYNLSDIQSAIGLHQLRRQDTFIEQRTRYANLYNEAFAECAQLDAPPDDARNRHCWHLYAIRLKLDELCIDRGEFIRELHRNKIGASVHFIPIPLHSYYAPLLSDGRNRCPRALELYPRLVSLPLYPAMTESDVLYVADTVKSILARHCKRQMTG